MAETAEDVKTLSFEAALEQLEQIVQKLESGRAPQDYLVEEGYVEEQAFYQAIANSIGANVVDLSDFDRFAACLARLL